jgi:hypothetical protein
MSENPSRDAHEASRALYEALRRLGVPDDSLASLTARQDWTGVYRVVVPPLPLDAVAHLTQAILSGLGSSRREPGLGRAHELGLGTTGASGTPRLDPMRQGTPMSG